MKFRKLNNLHLNYGTSSNEENTIDTETICLWFIQIVNTDRSI